MGNAANLGPRPAAHLISFAPECFELGPEVAEYVIVKLAPSYPEIYSIRATAEARAKMLGRTVTERTTRKMIRVRWF